MATFFLASFTAGLVLTVFAMLHGVERRSGFAINRAVIAGFATAFGVVGYPLIHSTALRHQIVLLIAGVAGIAGAAAALALVAAWAIPSAKADVIDERYLLQGSFARVLAVDDDGLAGTITYQADGSTRTAAARGLDGIRLDIGTDVVIERIEEGIAYVEPWTQVEARL